MQTVAQPCQICSRKIAVANEGTWCAACESIFHVGCITELQGVCPKCRRTRQRPEEVEVVAQLCTECLTLHPAAAPTCQECGSSMAYRTRAAYECRAVEIRSHARQSLTLGAFMIMAGMLLIAFFWLLLMGYVLANYIVVSGTVLVAGMAVIVAGLRKLRIGRRLMKFR